MSRTSLVFVLLIGSGLGAQQPGTVDPDAPALVQPFAQLVGSWRAEGQFRAGAEEPARSWTALVEARWVLGGHFVQEDMEVRLGDAAPLQIRTLYGWDGARDRFVAASVSNDGRSRLSEVTWTGARELVAVTLERIGGSPAVVQGTWEFGEGRYGYRLEQALGGSWQRSLSGEFRRVDDLPARAPDASRDGAAIGAEMAEIALLAGDYGVEGERVDPAGRTLATTTGQDRLWPMYGGQILAGRASLGAEGAAELEAHRYLAWNPSKRRYQIFSFDDAGGVGVMELRWDGEDALVGEAVESDGVETLLASTRIELGSGGVRRVQSRTVRSTGEIVGQVALRYRSTEEKK
jgi:hypothetical protein